MKSPGYSALSVTTNLEAEFEVIFLKELSVDWRRKEKSNPINGDGHTPSRHMEVDLLGILIESRIEQF